MELPVQMVRCFSGFLIHKALAAVDEEYDLDLDPALAMCVQLGLTGLHAVPLPKPVTPRLLTVTAFAM